MNKFKEAINKIEINEWDRKRMLNNILNNQKIEKKFNYNSFIMKFALFLLIFVLFSGTCYAVVKIFNFDEKFKAWYGITDEELDNYGVSGNDINIIKDFDDATITINQSILDEKEVYLMVEIKGKKEPIYLGDAYLAKVEKTDESIFDNEQNIYDDIDYCISKVIFGCTSRGLSRINEEKNTNGYAISFSVDGKLENSQPVILRLISDEKIYDISFTLNKNDIKTKIIEVNEIVYNENEIEARIKEIHLTPFRVVVYLEYNKDVELLTDDERELITHTIFDSYESTYVVYKDGTKEELTLFGPTLVVADGVYGESEAKVKDIETIESITINGLKVFVTE